MKHTIITLLCLFILQTSVAQITRIPSEEKSFYLQNKNQDYSLLPMNDLLRLKTYTKQQAKLNINLAIFSSIASTVIIAGYNDPVLLAPMVLAGAGVGLFFTIKGNRLHQKSYRYNDEIIADLVKLNYRQ